MGCFFTQQNRSGENLVSYLADVNLADKDGKTPFDLATDKEIKTLLKEAAEKTDDVNPVSEPSTDSEGDQEEDAGIREKEKQESAGQEIQIEEQPSSFLSNLFYILTKPFCLIVSFVGGFFSWLFGYDEPSTESDQTIVPEQPSNSGEEELTNYQKSVENSHNII